MTDSETAAVLTKVAQAAEEAVSAGKRSSQSIATSDQLVMRAGAAMADVYAHFTSRVGTLRQQLDDLEKAADEARERAHDHVKQFMQLVTDGEEATRGIEQAMARLGEHLTRAQ